MKGKVLLTIMGAMAAFLPVSAAEYKPLLEEGKSWTCRNHGTNYASNNPFFYGTGMGSFTQYFTAEVAGDTIVDGKQCWRVVRHGHSTDASRSYTANYILCEEDGVVSWCKEHWDGGNVFVPIMYFNVNVGDELRIYDEFDEETKYSDCVKECGTVVGSDGVERKEWKISGLYDDYATSWVEGIGYSYGWYFMLFSISGHDCYAPMSFATIDCSVNGKSIFTNKDFKLVTVADDPEMESLFAPGKTWTMARGNDEFTVKFVGDTLVYGIPAKHLIDSNGKDYTVIEYKGIIYSFFDKNGSIKPLYNAVPLMNINLKEGHSTYRYEFGEEWDPYEEELTNRHKCNVRSVNTLTVNGVERKEWVVESEAGDVVASWVEGIGSPDAQSWVEMHMPADYDLRMIDCRQDGEVIFRAEDFSHQSGIAEVRADSAKRSGFYDLQGRRVATPARGLYIVDGVKRLLR